MSEKTRVGVTVDKETVEQIKADLKALRLPPATFSVMVDDWLRAFAPTLHKMAEKKVRGEQMSFNEVVDLMADSVRTALKP